MKLIGIASAVSLLVLTGSLAAQRPQPAAERVAMMAAAKTEGTATTHDPRWGLAPGLYDAGQAMENLHLVAALHQPQGMASPNPYIAGLVSDSYQNSDLAFDGNLVIQGNYHGVIIYNVSDPENPRLETVLVCPGGQGDVSAYKNLLFVSVENGGTVNCGNPAPLSPAYLAARRQAFREHKRPPQRPASADNFEGVRIFDISHPARPRQVAAVQTCRGSHTNTLVTDPSDPNNVYIYVNGISGVRPAAELKGCNDDGPNDPNSSLYGDYVIKVPVAHPEQAAVVTHARIFASANTGAIAGLWRGGNHGTDTQFTTATTACHDITAYPALGMAAGACEGNGILLDIRHPAHPVRIADVADPNFSFWHSATFNNAGTKVVFTDEWGGGVAARCRATDPLDWGADAIFSIVGSGDQRQMEFDGYYKLPVAQSKYKNCTAHNGSLIPVPGRDLEVQAWYQGGLSIFDFTDAQHVQEIAYFDRGAINNKVLNDDAGYWSVYWYNGYIYGSEIARGLDVLRLKPSTYLTQNEIDAARLARFSELDVQSQPHYTWPARFVVARAYLDELGRDQAVSADQIATLNAAMTQVKSQSGRARRTGETKLNALAMNLRTQAASANALDAGRMRACARVILTRDRQLR
ncbi:MAG: LVIVD repeat-containing protein [Terriglobales bacterium]